MAWKRAAASVGLLFVLGSGTAFAHPDDPKVLDRLPRYEGEGWREVDGLRGPPLQFMNQGLTLRSWLTLPQFGAATSGNVCWGYTSPSGREYAIMGLSNGTGFVEVTNPAAADLITVIAGPNSDWRDMKAYGQFAYAVSEGGSGIQVFNLTQIDNGIVTLQGTVTTGGETATHTLALDEVSGFLYRAGGGSNGLRIYSLANPATPVFVGSWSTRYVHEVQVVTYTEGPYAGRQIAFACAGFNGGFTETGIDILDVTNKSNIFSVARVFYPSPSYSHQIWLSPDRKYAYLNDELDEDNRGITSLTRIFDVSDLQHPVHVGNFTSGIGSIDHNLYVRDTLIFEANYRSGLRVFDATDPLNPVQVAFYDTFPSSDAPEFNGLWCNYPFFASKTILGADIESGLFVWTLDGWPLSIRFPNGRPSQLPTDGGVIEFEVVENIPGALNPATPALFYDNGSGFTAAALESLGNNRYAADVPGAGCIQTIEFYVTAQSNGGINTRSPVTSPQAYEVLMYDTETEVVSYNFETAAGWQVNVGGTDTADTGNWVRGDPVGTLAQPELDRSAAGTQCWFTGQGAIGGALGDVDVDLGTTTLTSPVLDLSATSEPVLRYWRWYSNDRGGGPNEDPFTVEVSSNGGSSWSTLEVVGPGGVGTSGGWLRREFMLADVIAPTAQMRFRFRAVDSGVGSIVEAALDDFSIVDLGCLEPDPCPGDVNGSGAIDLDDLLVVLGSFDQSGPGLPGDVDGNGSVDLDDLLIVLGNFGVVCA